MLSTESAGGGKFLNRAQTVRAVERPASATTADIQTLEVSRITLD